MNSCGYVPIVVDSDWSLVGIVPPNGTSKKMKQLAENGTDFQNRSGILQHVSDPTPMVTMSDRPSKSKPKDNVSLMGVALTSNRLTVPDNVLVGFGSS